ncbi:subtilisin-like protein [Cubamyces menziesii]|nr:subtilisin-like protein [Cubamyces menziesii]
MITLRILIVLLGATLAVSAISLPGSPRSRRVLHERRDAPPHGWTLHRRADPDTVLPLSIALRQSNMHNLDDYLQDIADPESPNYGQWWTPARVVETFRPSAHTLDTVRTWLAEEDIASDRVQMSKDGGYLRANVTVTEAERLLATEYYVYQHEDGSEDVGCHHGYHLPAHVVEHVDLVMPTVQFETVRLHGYSKQRKRRAVAQAQARDAHAKAAGYMKRPNGVAPKKATQIWMDVEHCDQLATIDCFRALYNFYPNLTETKKNTIGVVELGDQLLNLGDLKMFLEKFNPNAAENVPKFIGIDTDTNAGNLTTATDPNFISEGDLDFELVIGLLGAEQEVQLYEVGSGGSVNFFLDGIDGSFCTFEGGDDPNIDGVIPNEDCGTAPPANVFSVSFTGGEDLPPFYMQRECQEFGKLTMTGITFLFASGDDGVASNGDNLCLADNGTAVPGPGNFLPNFPSTCPYVTAVGATQVDPGKSVHDPESAPTAFGSGGGFSNVFPRAHFQHRQVAQYLHQLGDAVDPRLFNRTGRAIPDVSANGFPTAAVIDANYTIVGGSSAATPIWAAVVVAINDARLAHGKGPVGHINHAIYSHLFADAFHDVTNGTNPGCGTDGFPAMPGWDPVTGLGTPNFPVLLKRFLALK